MREATWRDMPRGLLVTGLYFIALPALLAWAALRYLLRGR